MPPPYRWHFFISYTQSDRLWAEWIGEALEEAGYAVCLQAWDFLPGSNWILRMQEAVQGAERTISIASKAYFESFFARMEWSAVLAEKSDGRLLPVRVEDVELPGLFKPLVSVDLFGTADAEARERLLAAATEERMKPSEGRPMPSASRPPAESRGGFPGSLPGVWSVPRLKDRLFTGREEVLRVLEGGRPDEGRFVRVHVIVGLKGVGKTHIAAELAYRVADECRIVWWIRANDDQSIVDDYVALGRALGLRSQPDPESTAAAVRQHLESSGARWLLIFDDAADPEALRGHLPRRGMGKVVVTSYNPNWESVGEVVPIEVFEADESVRFLTTRAPGGADDGKNAAVLAGLLGHLPLALAQAGAYIETTGTNVARYLELYVVHRRELLARGAPLEHEAVAVTWNIGFSEARRTPRAADILEIAAFYASTPIPRSLFELPDGGLHPAHPAVVESFLVDDAIAALRRLGLITTRADTLSVHVLVQTVLRDRLKDEGRTDAVQTRSIALLGPKFVLDQDDVSSWERCGALYRHVFAALRGDDEEARWLPGAGTLMSTLGQYFFVRGNYRLALSIFNYLAALEEAHLAPDDPNRHATECDRATALATLGDWSGAREAYERALAIDEQAFGSNDSSLINDLNNLAVVLLREGQTKQALAAQQRAIAIAERLHGPEGRSVAGPVSAMAGTLVALGDLDGALAAYERSRAIIRKHFGNRHLQLATDACEVAAILESRGDHQGAFREYGEALEILGDPLFETQPERATVAWHAFGMLERWSRFRLAKDFALVALEIDEMAFGDHPKVALGLRRLSGVLRALGDYAGARAALQRALAIDEAEYGNDSPMIVADLDQLSVTLRLLDDPESAKAVEERALRIESANLKA